jgi:alkylhydroperoxidase family enzyme
MSQIPLIDYDTASEEIRTAHDEEVKVRGRMTNMKRTLLHSPAAHRIYAEWFTLRAELGDIGDRPIWIFSHAISKACKSKIAITFFRRALISNGFNPDALELSEEEALFDAFGRAIVADSNAVPAEIWAQLKQRYDARTLVDLVAFAGIMIATAVFNNVVDVDFDPELEAFAEAVG